MLRRSTATLCKHACAPPQRHSSQRRGGRHTQGWDTTPNQRVNKPHMRGDGYQVLLRVSVGMGWGGGMSIHTHTAPIRPPPPHSIFITGPHCIPQGTPAPTGGKLGGLGEPPLWPTGQFPMGLLVAPPSFLRGSPPPRLTSPPAGSSATGLLCSSSTPPSPPQKTFHPPPPHPTPPALPPPDRSWPSYSKEDGREEAGRGELGGEDGGVKKIKK